jgi:hypothetical protein
MDLSIIIIACKNDVSGTERTLRSVRDLNADVLLYDTSGTGFSRNTAAYYGARLSEGNWEGYDSVRFKAARHALHDWILMLHTGEVPDERLRTSLKNFSERSPYSVYRIRFKNKFGDKWLNHGEWGGYSHIRMANKRGIELECEKLNEQLLLQPGIDIRQLKGHILHSPNKDKRAFIQRMKKDACIAAIKYHRLGRKVGLTRLYLSPVAAFFKEYFLKLGFLDGREGYTCACLGARYNFLKYLRLRQLNKNIKILP